MVTVYPSAEALVFVARTIQSTRYTTTRDTVVCRGNQTISCKRMIRMHGRRIGQVLRSISYDLQGAPLRRRHTPPATFAQEGKIVRSGQRSMIDYKCKLAT